MQGLLNQAPGTLNVPETLMIWVSLWFFYVFLHEPAESFISLEQGGELNAQQKVGEASHARCRT